VKKRVIPVERRGQAIRVMIHLVTRNWTGGSSYVRMKTGN
jgi:hypothetical protein